MTLFRCSLLAWAAALATASAQPYVVNTIAGHGKLAYAGDGKAATTVNFFSPNRVAFDTAGNLYFTELYYHRVFKVSTGGALSAVAGNGESTFAGEGGAATAAALPTPEGIAVDALGNLYVGTSARICKLSGGKVRTIAGTGEPGYSGDLGVATAARIHTPSGIVVDSAGRVYFSDSTSSVIRRIDTDGIVTTVAGTGTPGYSGDGSAGTSAQLSTPEGLALDPASGTLYIADRFNHRVRRLDASGIIYTFAGTGVSGTGGSGLATGAKLFQPEGVAVDAGGNVYIADASNSQLKMVNPQGLISVFGPAIRSLNDVAVSPSGWLAAPDFLQHVVNKIVWDSTSASVNVMAGVVRNTALGDRGPATSAYFLDPWGVVADAAGNWYVADNADQRLRKVAASDRSIFTVAGTGIFGASLDGQVATASAIAQPRALAADASGTVYFNSACQIRALLPSGTLKTIAGSGGCSTGVNPSPALDAQFQFPKGLALDSAGMIYIADTDNNRIRRLDPSNSMVTTIAGNGQPGYAGNGSDGLEAKLNYPLGLAVDSKGNVYFADENNHRVRKITVTTAGNTISDFAGTGVCASAADGPATASPLCYPTSVALDAAGNVYIADSGYIRRVGLDGRLTTIAGNGRLQMTGEGESATTTGISPFYVALDTKGRVCFSDWTNLRVRCLDTAPVAPVSAVTVVNAATFLSGPVAPGEIVTVFGTGIGPASLVSAQFDAAAPQVATTLAGTQIAFDGIAAPLLYVSATQSSAIVPFAVANKTSTKIEVTYQGKSAGSTTLSVAPAAPGLFTMGASGIGQGAILNQDWSVNSAAKPAARGEVLMLFGTGGGVTSPATYDGQFTTGTPSLAIQPVVTIGGAEGKVWYAGAAPGMVAGVFQINVQVPDSAPTGDKVPIVVKSLTAASPATVTVAVK